MRVWIRSNVSCFFVCFRSLGLDLFCDILLNAIWLVSIGVVWFQMLFVVLWRPETAKTNRKSTARRWQRPRQLVRWQPWPPYLGQTQLFPVADIHGYITRWLIWRRMTISDYHDNASFAQMHTGKLNREHEHENAWFNAVYFYFHKHYRQFLTRKLWWQVGRWIGSHAAKLQATHSSPSNCNSTDYWQFSLGSRFTPNALSSRVLSLMSWF